MGRMVESCLTMNGVRRFGRGDVIDELLTYMLIAGNPPSDMPQLLPIQHFSGADPSFDTDSFELPDDKHLLFVNPKHPEMSPSLDLTDGLLDQRLITRSDVDEAMEVKRIRVIPASSIRGRTTATDEAMVEFATGTIWPNGKFTSGPAYFAGSRKGQVWMNVTNYQGMGIRLGNNSGWNGWAADLIRMAISMQLTFDYEWRVELGLATGVSISFVTTPTGAREVFRLRDVPPGRTRRAALHNWVSEHWRCKHNDEADRAYVRKHLRGRQAFTWNGLQCVISPSKFDVGLNQRLREERREL